PTGGPFSPKLTSPIQFWTSNLSTDAKSEQIKNNNNTITITTTSNSNQHTSFTWQAPEYDTVGCLLE
ncbi:MAG: hypothetical protein MHMPM18_000974, partial [Marteilia pararefringens]